jgi:hypothetical protein
LVLLPSKVDGREHFIGMQIDSTNLVRTALAAGKSFDRIKTSEQIRDKINSPFQAIMIAGMGNFDDAQHAPLLERSFSKILEIVKELPFRE